MIKVAETKFEINPEIMNKRIKSHIPKDEKKGGSASDEIRSIIAAALELSDIGVVTSIAVTVENNTAKASFKINQQIINQRVKSHGPKRKKNGEDMENEIKEVISGALENSAIGDVSSVTVKIKEQ